MLLVEVHMDQKSYFEASLEYNHFEIIAKALVVLTFILVWLDSDDTFPFFLSLFPKC